jgi:hypothetical protein
LGCEGLEQEQITGRDHLLRINQNRPNCVPKRKQGRQPFLHCPICSIPRLDSAVLRTMTAKVAAFMMYEPPDRPPWRAETASVKSANFLKSSGVGVADILSSV